jgi:hypothetical protein
MGAVVITLALDQPFMQDGMTYRLNKPADTPDKKESEYPFQAYEEHTNLIEAKHNNGQTILY